MHWAQFQEPGADPVKWGGPWGIVDEEGTVKASFNAFEIYNRMPLRATATVINPGVTPGVAVAATRSSDIATELPINGDTPGVSALASYNTTRASLTLWSTSDTPVAVTTHMLSAPFPTATLTVYRIDAEHCSYGNTHNISAATLVPAEPERLPQPTGGANGVMWHGILPPRAVVYLELNKA